MSTINGTSGFVNEISGRNAGKLRLLGTPSKFVENKENKKGIAKLKAMGIVEFQRIVYQNVVFTTHDKALIQLIKDRNLGEITLISADDSTESQPRVNEAGYLSRTEVREFAKEERVAKWEDPATFINNPALLSKMPNLNELTTASVE